MKKYNNFITEKINEWSVNEIHKIVQLYNNRKIDFDTTIQKLEDTKIDISFILLKFYQHYDVIKYCLEKGADPNYQEESWSSTILSWVTYNSRNDEWLESVKILVEYGANINFSPSNNDDYALTLTVRPNYNNSGIVSYLLEKGSDISEENVKDILEYLPDVIPALEKYHPILLRKVKKGIQIKRFKI